MTEEGKIISSAIDKATLFNIHFVNKAKLPDADKLLNFRYISDMSHHLLSSVTITEESIEKTIKLLHVRKGNAPDNLSNELLKESPVLSISLCKLFNASLSLGKVPKIWKQANIISVFKGKGNKQDKLQILISKLNFY